MQLFLADGLIMINCEHTNGDWDSCTKKECDFPRCVKEYIEGDDED